MGTLILLLRVTHEIHEHWSSTNNDDFTKSQFFCNKNVIPTWTHKKILFIGNDEG